MKRNGKRLFGILHTPEVIRTDTAVILLSPGIKNRVAPHRLYVKMARCFCELGFTVFRFDPEGLGDSDGEINERLAADLYGSIQVGRFVEDTISSMDWMQREHDVQRFILSGLCGEAITGLLVGARDTRVDGLLSIGIPVILDSSRIDRTKYITDGELDGLKNSYVQKRYSPRAWARFFTFRSDYRVIFKILAKAIKAKISWRQSQNKPDDLSSQMSSPNVDGNFNRLFVTAFRMMAQSSHRILLIFGEHDSLYHEFDEKFVRHYGRELVTSNHTVELHLCKDARHILEMSWEQRDMLEHACKWLSTNYTCQD
jgi:hypothetical protein